VKCQLPGGQQLQIFQISGSLSSPGLGYALLVQKGLPGMVISQQIVEPVPAVRRQGGTTSAAS
jgi:hypothetical protein